MKKINNFLIGGSKNLIIRDLLHRGNKDIDIILLTNDIVYIYKLKRFLRKFKIYHDVLKLGLNKHYDKIVYNNRELLLVKLYIVLYYKYIQYKNNKNKKHRIDLINVFHNLGREKALEEIDNIKNNTPINKDDVKELLNLMEIGISNETEI